LSWPGSSQPYADPVTLGADFGPLFNREDDPIVFDTLSDRLSAAFAALRSKGRLTDADLDATAREIRIALLEADVALPVVKSFIAALKERARGAEVHQALNPAQQVVKIVHEELVRILGGETRRLSYAKNPPTVIMLAGLQGAGKTTLAGKLALWLRKAGHQPLLVAADLQRPNAVQQLQVVGQQAEVEVYAPEPGSGIGDPVQVAQQSVEHAKRHLHDIVIVDTAGRLGIDAELMAQAAAIRDAVRPDETLFVVDAMIGQDAVVTAEAFRDGVGFTGVVLTKLDGDARGGAALSVREVTGQPIMFASTGEKLADFDVFHPDRMASRILGMGDVMTLIEQAQTAFDEDQQERMTAKLVGGHEFTLDDFLEQMLAVKKMGPIANVLGMLPGAGQMKQQLAQVEDKHLDRAAAIIRSMTPAERADPKIVKGSRRLRIANGSGVPVAEVNQLVDRFFAARKMMKQMGGAMGLPGMRRKGAKGAKGKRKGKGGRSGLPRTPGAGLPGGLPGLGIPGGGLGGPGAPAPTGSPGAGLPPGFSMPGIDFSKLPKSR
jgi:signal recognition particle subunit SRP54